MKDGGALLRGAECHFQRACSVSPRSNSVRSSPGSSRRTAMHTARTGKKTHHLCGRKGQVPPQAGLRGRARRPPHGTRSSAPASSAASVGYGADGVLHSAKMLELSGDLPVKIEAVDSRGKDRRGPAARSASIVEKGLVEVSDTMVISVRASKPGVTVACDPGHLRHPRQHRRPRGHRRAVRPGRLPGRHRRLRSRAGRLHRVP